MTPHKPPNSGATRRIGADALARDGQLAFQAARHNAPRRLRALCLAGLRAQRHGPARRRGGSSASEVHLALGRADLGRLDIAAIKACSAFPPR